MLAKCRSASSCTSEPWPRLIAAPLPPQPSPRVTTAAADVARRGVGPQIGGRGDGEDNDHTLQGVTDDGGNGGCSSMMTTSSVALAATDAISVEVSGACVIHQDPRLPQQPLAPSSPKAVGSTAPLPSSQCRVPLAGGVSSAAASATGGGDARHLAALRREARRLRSEWQRRAASTDSDL